MEVGAVKQAFNNEIILLKKNLNQAKIHVIHKLTRKAKTLTEKKAPEHLKEKLKKKAESAVSEVLLIKKLKSRDIAKFMITHTGKVEDYINRPNVDNDKACARLILNKALQDKYKFIRNRFGNVPIKDLFMSRQERRKIKKEARDAQKNKRKEKQGKVVNAQGDWDVEEMEMGDESKDLNLNENGNKEEDSGYELEHSIKEKNNVSVDENDSELGDNDDIHSIEIEENQKDLESEGLSENSNSGDEATDDNDDDDDNSLVGENDDDGSDTEVGKFVKLNTEKEIKPSVVKLKPLKKKINDTETHNIETSKNKLIGKKQIDKKVKENKNKNLKEKLQNRKFKKDDYDTQLEGNKVVDPFFMTATGEKYLSLAEPRQPDEIKEVHKQGNRQERRAAMFGHAIRHKPRRDDFRQNNSRYNKFDQQDNNNGPGGFRNKNDRFNKDSNVNGNNSKFNNQIVNFNDRSTKFNSRNSNFNDRSNTFNDRNSKFDDRNVNKNNLEQKEEKLHPSWEAKRKLKSAMTLLPAKGKKIVFD